MNSIKLLIWNVEWAKGGSDRGKGLIQAISGESPDIVCLTECYEDFLLGDGYIICSDRDYGYQAPEGRRKVLLWSKNPWENIDAFGDISMPRGRYIAGITETAIGRIQIIGVCIPWREAHVRTGRKDRAIWEDHLAYLGGLDKILKGNNFSEPVLVMGDYNQRIPRKRNPKEVYETMKHVFEKNNLTIGTAGEIAGVSEQSIDHLAHSGGICVEEVRGIARHIDDGLRLSDHFGVVVEIGLQKT